MRTQIPRPTAGRIKTQADIVFCVDATGSMEPCIDGLRTALHTFVTALQTAGDVDYRLRLIGFRDYHSPACRTPWDVHEFTSDPAEFCRQLDALRPIGGGDAPESALDVLYIAIGSDWRKSKTHKTILLFTDDDTHPTVAKCALRPPDNDVRCVIQALQTLRHVMLFITAPRFPLYEDIQRCMQDAERCVIAHFVPYERGHSGLAGVDWSELLQEIGQTVSDTSVDMMEGGASEGPRDEGTGSARGGRW